MTETDINANLSQYNKSKLLDEPLPEHTELTKSVTADIMYGLTYENANLLNLFEVKFNNPPYNLLGTTFTTTNLPIQSLIWMTYRRNFEPIGKFYGKYKTEYNKIQKRDQQDEKIEHEILSAPNSPENSEKEPTSIINSTLQTIYNSNVFPSSFYTQNDSNQSNRFSSNITSDAGWGCAVRVGQMLLAEVYQRLLTPSNTILERPSNHQLQNLLKNFNNFHSEPFSLQNLVLKYAESDPKYTIGTWLGPNNVCHCIKKVVEDANKISNLPKLNVFVCMDSTVVVPDLPQVEDPLLILIPLRLGLEKFYRETFENSLLEIFKIQSCVGIIGGRPRSAYYFFGASESGELLALDPHTVQDHSDPQIFSEYSTKSPLILPNVTYLDPSLALGFLVNSKSELDNLLDKIDSSNLCAVMKILPNFDFSERSIPSKSNICMENDININDDFDLPDTDDEFEILG